MAYLYGDSTESGLELNYIELLRDFLDFGAQLLMSEHRIVTAARAGSDQHDSAERELERLDQLTRVVSEALDRFNSNEPSTPSESCAAQLRGLATDAIRRATEGVKSQVAEADRQIALKSQRERGGNLRLLERFLRDHDLPEQSHRVDLRFDPALGRYQARVVAQAPPALEWSFALELPKSSLFSSPVKVLHVCDGELEVRVPEASGLVRKRMKLRPQKLGGLYLWSLERSRGMTTLLLRAAPQADEAGLNLSIGSGAAQLSLVRVQKGGDESPPFEPTDADRHKLIELCAKVTREADALAQRRASLLEASFDGRPLESHDDPTELVRRLVQRLAPVVQEIGRRSLSSDELVLKRVLADDRREEIFASKADLRAKLTPVPASLRAVFAPLGLGVLDTVGDDDCTTELDLSQGRGNAPALAPPGGIIGDDEETAVAVQPLPPTDANATGFADRLAPLEGAPTTPSAPAAKPPGAAAKPPGAAAKPLSPPGASKARPGPSATAPAAKAANGAAGKREKGPTAPPPATTAKGSIAPPPKPNANASVSGPGQKRQDTIEAALAELESESL